MDEGVIVVLMMMVMMMVAFLITRRKITRNEAEKERFDGDKDENGHKGKSRGNIVECRIQKW